MRVTAAVNSFLIAGKLLERLMFKFALAAALLCASASYGQVPPNDSDKYQVIVVTPDQPTPACARLAAALQTPELSRIEQRCKSFRFNVSSPIYLARYANALPPSQLPIIALARPDGGVIFKASGTEIPDGPSIAVAMRQMATIDRAQAPASLPLRPLITPDGDPRFPNLRPDGFIPDTLVVKPQVALPAATTDWLIVGGILLAFMLFGSVAIVFVIGIVLFTRSP